MYEHHGHHSHCPRYRRSSAVMTTSGIKDSPMRRLFYLIDITVIGLLYFALDAATNAIAFSRNFRVDIIVSTLVRFLGVHLVLVANARGQCCGPRVEEAQRLAAIDSLRRDGV